MSAKKTTAQGGPRQSAALSARHMYETGTDPNMVLQALESEASKGVDGARSAKLESHRKNQQHLDDFTEMPSVERRHNEAVLAHLRSFSKMDSMDDGMDYITRMRGILNQLQITKESNSPELSLWKGAADCDAEELEALATRRLIVLRHNLGLSLFSAGKGEEALSILAPLAGHFSDADASNHKRHLNENTRKGSEISDTCDDSSGISEGNQDEEGLLCRVGFLVLDCLLSIGRNSIGLNTQQDTSECTSDDSARNTVSALHVLQWIDGYVENRERLSPDAAESQPLPEGKTGQEQAGNEANQDDLPPLALDAETVTELRFRLHLYRTRFLLTFQSTCLFPSLAAGDDSSDRDASMRLARKELKSTMEIYQRKLALPNNIAALPNIRLSSEEKDAELRSKMLSAEGTHTHHTKLHGQNQSALNLKAKWEYLKGNVKKSLKLCAESRMVAERRRSDGIRDKIDEAIHYNNLAILHQTAGKVNLALHYYNQAIYHAENAELERTLQSPAMQVTFAWDGISRTLPIADLLSNASICALQARQYELSYSWMLQCLSRSQHFHGKNPRCWLRMAECCIGVHKVQKAESPHLSFTATNRNGVLFAGLEANELPSASVRSERSSTTALWKDISELRTDPLDRASQCLRRAYTLTAASIGAAANDKSHVRRQELEEESAVLMESTLLSLAYISLERRRNATALRFASSVQRGCLPRKTTWAEGGTHPSVASRKRRSAIASIYVAEARRRLGMNVSLPASAGDEEDIPESISMEKIVGDMNMSKCDHDGNGFSPGSSSKQHQKRLRQEATVLRASFSAMQVSRGQGEKTSELAQEVFADFPEVPRGLLFNREMSSGNTEGKALIEAASLKSLHLSASVAKNALVYSALTNGQTGVAVSLLKKTTVSDNMLT